MKGIGFESEDEGYTNNDGEIEQPKKKKKRLFGKKKQELNEDLTITPSQEFDKDQFNALKEGEEGTYSNSYGSSYGSSGYSSYGNGTASYGTKNFVFFSPSTYEEIKRLVEYLKQGEPAIVNLDKISDMEAQRSLDFISGAACALGGKLQRITGNFFLVTPDGYNITKPTGQD